MARRKPASPAPEGVDMAQIGVTGLKVYGGYLSEEFLPDLRGLNGLRKYREMADNDPICGAVLFAISMLIRQAEWDFQSVNDSEAAEQAADFCRSVFFEDMDSSFDDVIAEVLTMLTYGFAVMEPVYRRRLASAGSRADDGKIGLRKISLRGQETVLRWLFDDEDNLLGVEQQFNSAVIQIPMDRLMLFRTTSVKNNPEGRSIFRSAYRAWYFRKKMQEIEGIGGERDLAGLPVALVPAKIMRSDADQQDKVAYRAFQDMVKQLRRDQREGIVMPSDRDQSGNLMYELKLLSAGGTRAFDTDKIISRYSREIAMCALADFIFLGQQSVGSHALSADKTNVFRTAISGWLEMIEAEFNKTIVTRLWKLNGFSPELQPSLRHSGINDLDIGQIGSFIQQMSAAGMPLFPDRDLENSLREMAGLPEAPEEGLGADLEDPGAEGAGKDGGAQAASGSPGSGDAGGAGED